MQRKALKNAIMCVSNKKVYYSKSCADTVLKRIKDKAKSNKSYRKFKLQRSYKCPLCNFWHLTSKP